MGEVAFEIFQAERKDITNADDAVEAAYYQLMALITMPKWLI
jgi:hypothetical protein